MVSDIQMHLDLNARGGRGDVRSLNFTFRCSAIRQVGRTRPLPVPLPSVFQEVRPPRYGNHAGFHVGTIVGRATEIAPMHIGASVEALMPAPGATGLSR